MYKKTVTLFKCRPLNARVSLSACGAKNTRAWKVLNKPKIERDYEGGVLAVAACVNCKGVTGLPVTVKVTAQAPKEKQLVPDIDGGFTYV